MGFKISKLFSAASPLALSTLWTAGLLTAGQSWGAEFPPITQAERDLVAVPFAPGAAAVVLHRRGELRFRDLSRQASSRLSIDLRLKILTEEGLDRGIVEIPHSRRFRLGSLEGRTVTPDGQVITLPEDAIFREERSRSERIYVTKATFPAVSVGSILDVRVELFWDSFYFLEPWYFAQDLPVITSKISYFKPDSLGITTWARQIGSKEMQIESARSPLGMQIDVSLDEIPAIPGEPHSFPDADLSSRFMVIPVSVVSSSTPIPLLEDWRTVCKLFESEIYKEFRKGGRSSIKKVARQLTEGAAGQGQVARRLLAFVRDEIVTSDRGLGIWIFGDRDAGDVLESRSGTTAEKALLLQAMLESVKIEPDLLWVADRRQGRIDPEVANPDWFTGIVLAAEVGSEKLFLDPSDAGNAAGMLPFFLENTHAINCRQRRPEAIQLPVAPAEDNRRRAHLDLALDEEGRLSGTATMTLMGHAAWRVLGVHQTLDAAAQAWTRDLEGRFEGFDLDGLTVREDVPAQQVEVSWQLRQRDEALLGDEASLRPSSLLQREHPFALPPDRRRTPVQMDFGFHDELTLELTWPEGWKVDVIPGAIDFPGGAGVFSVEIDGDLPQRRLTYKRTLDQPEYEFLGNKAYSQLRRLYGVAFENDGEELVLVRE